MTLNPRLRGRGAKLQAFILHEFSGHGLAWLSYANATVVHSVSSQSLLILKQNFKTEHRFYLDLDLESSRIQMDALGHTPTPFLSVESS